MDDKMILHLRGGETLTTNRMTVTDSTFVVHTLVVDGRDQAVTPREIRRTDVESMEKIRPRWPLILGISAGVLALFIYFESEMDGWSEGT